MKNKFKYFILLIVLILLIRAFCSCNDSNETLTNNIKNEVSTDDTANFENTVDYSYEGFSEPEEDIEIIEKETTDTLGDVVGETPQIKEEIIVVESVAQDSVIENSLLPDAAIKEPNYSNSSATIEVIDGITYVNGILIVNKTYPLPDTYAPQYDQEVLDSLNRMFSDALKAGYTLKTKSGYRSYTDQKIIYNNYVAKDGKALADTYSARPGHSEHQSGLAFDLNQLLKSFGDTPEGIWLAQNCHKYGFIIRYPKGKESITGYMYEPWHVRYLGVETATKVFESGLCLEEYLGITSEYSY